MPNSQVIKQKIEDFLSERSRQYGEITQDEINALGLVGDVIDQSFPDAEVTLDELVSESMRKPGISDQLKKLGFSKVSLKNLVKKATGRLFESTSSKVRKFLNEEISAEEFLEVDDYAIPGEPKSHGRSSPQCPDPEDLDIPESEIPYSKDSIPNRDVWPKWVSKQNLIDEWGQWFDGLAISGEAEDIIGADWDYASAKFRDWLDRNGIDY